MGFLQIQLLGGFTVNLAGQPVQQFRSARGRALLAFLAAQPDRFLSRASLATLLWGDLSESAAKTNLRVEISDLKKRLDAHPALEISRGELRLRGELAEIDVQRLLVFLDHFWQLPAEKRDDHLGDLAAALAHYKGDFLAGFDVGGAPSFEEWRMSMQEQLHTQVMQGYDLLLQRWAARGSWPELARAATNQLALQPWHEAAHRALMQALAGQGRPAEAREQYGRCRQILQEMLGVEPSAATTELLQRLAGSTPFLSEPSHNLQASLSAVFGRDDEIDQLSELLARQRLVTITGLGGVGKSRLAQAAGLASLNHFPDGVWFVPLAPIEGGGLAAEQIALAIGAAAGLSLTGSPEALNELCQGLGDRRQLLILDNWEHLLAAAAEMIEPLLSRTAVHLLNTSRVPLAHPLEQRLALTGLSPAAAFTLFTDRARRLLPAFDPHPFADDIANLAARVGGLPLGLELAASWVEHFSVGEIARSMADIAVEPQQAARLTDRHHSLSTVFEYSWRLLSPSEQRILALLSLFHGGFDREAAAAVAGSGFSELSALLARSLIQYVAPGRYDLHPLVQQYAAEKRALLSLAQGPERHSRYFLTRLAATATSERPARWLIDLDNLRQAWQETVARADVGLIGEVADPLGQFLRQSGRLLEGLQLFKIAVDRLDPDRDGPDLYAILLNWLSVFVRSLEGLTAAAPYKLRALELSRDPSLQVTMHLDLANSYAEVGRWDAVDFHFEQAELLTADRRDVALHALTVGSRIHINALHFRGDFAAGIAGLQEMLALVEHLGPSHDIHFELAKSLALLAGRYGDYALAIRTVENMRLVVQDEDHRFWQIENLLDRGLYKLFAGYFEEAIDHNRQALSLARELQLFDDIGLLSANLCMAMRQTEWVEEGLAFGQEGAELLKKLGNARMEGMARNRVGHALLELKRWPAAAGAYAAAIEVWSPQNHPNRFEALAGQGAAFLHMGDLPQALARVEEVLAYFERDPERRLSQMVEPIFLLLNCAAVLEGADRVAHARETLQTARGWIDRIAGRISDGEVRTVFKRRPDNRRVAQMAERLALSR